MCRSPKGPSERMALPIVDMLLCRLDHVAAYASHVVVEGMLLRRCLLSVLPCEMGTNSFIALPDILPSSLDAVFEAPPTK